MTRRVLHGLVLVLVGSTSAFAQSPWSDITGIPTPTWGLENVVAKARPSPWTSEVAGYYYVNNQTGTDSGRTYGTPSAPRSTIPTDLRPCAVVEVHGTYDHAHTSPNHIVANGTSSPTDGSCTFNNGSGTGPVFIRGQNISTLPIFTKPLEIRGHDIVIEYIQGLFPGGIDFAIDYSNYSTNNASRFALRHSDISGDLEGGGGVAVYGTGAQTVSDILLWNLVVHDFGDKDATEAGGDAHGIKIGSNTSNVWFVKSGCYNNGGDCIQIDDGQFGDIADTHHIFIGGNEMHHNRETGGTVKAASDVVFSHNVVHDHRPDEGFVNPGACLAQQYGPARVWFLFNITYNCDVGIAIAGNDEEYAEGTPGEGTFMLNNLIVNITHSEGASDGCAIYVAGGVYVYAVNNTVYGADRGLCVTPDSERATYAFNNIFDGITGYHINYASSGGQVFGESGNLYSPDFDLFLNGIPYHTAPPVTGSSLIRSSVDYVNSGTGDFRLDTSADGIDFNPTSVTSIYSAFYGLYGIYITKDILDQPRFVDTLDVGAYEYQEP
jgi:hypothetical protein